ncbi:MAG: GerAB/ArcD/ProY family transporter [Clostridia bacterium]|nr:GerAB/ArcD/ProY family transporter [Clostridia bacterium]
MKKELYVRQICLFFIAFLPVTKIFIMPSIISQVANEDLWISVLINVILDLFVLVAILNTCRKTNKTYIQLLEDVFGKTIAKIIMFLYVLYFLLKCFISINEQKTYVQLTLYETMPSVFYFLPFFIVCIFLCNKKMNVLGRLADVSWLLTTVGFVLLLSLSFSNVQFTKLLPVGANGGLNILHGYYRANTWFGDCVYLLFFMGKFNTDKKNNVKIILSYLGACLLVVIFAIFFFCIFTSIAGRQRFALTDISKYTTVINNVGRFDYIGIFCILFSTVVSVILPPFFACYLLRKIFNSKNTWVVSSIVTGIIFIVVILLTQYYSSIENFIFNYCNTYFILMAFVLPILTPLLLKKGEKYELKEN